MKDCLKTTKNGKLKRWISKNKSYSKYIYLSAILEGSKNIGLISQLDYNSWDGAIKLRNVSVHNNGFADISEKYNICGTKISFVKDGVIKVKLGTYPTLISSIIKLTKKWIDCFLKTHFNMETVE